MDNDGGFSLGFIAGIIVSACLTWLITAGIYESSDRNFQNYKSTMEKAEKICKEYGGVDNFDYKGTFECKENDITVELNWSE